MIIQCLQIICSDTLQGIEQDWETRPCSWRIETEVMLTKRDGKETERNIHIKWLAFDQKQCGWVSQLDEASMLPWKAVAAELNRASGVAYKLIYFLTGITALPCGALVGFIEHGQGKGSLLFCMLQQFAIFAFGAFFLYYFTLHRLAMFLAGKVLGIDQLKKAAAAGPQDQAPQAGKTASKASRSKSPGSRKSKGSVKID